MNEAQIEKLIAELESYARSCLSDFRYGHSCRVAAYAEELARQYGCTPRQQRLCFLAGIAHDVCKEQSAVRLLHLVQRDGQPVGDQEKDNCELLHGRAAAVLLYNRFGVLKKSLLRAVRCHTSGSVRFDAVGKILYIADKIEPGRKNCAYLREKAAVLPLDALFFEVLQEVIRFVEAKGRKVLPATYKVYRYYEQHRKNTEEKK
ncbi:MAG: bis(5'-nucleosyl)-tetraphosphatase (symmetrical) YqeK [Treponema sp.]